MVLSEDILLNAKHAYVLDGDGVQEEKCFEKIYFNRHTAEKDMYRLMNKYSTHTVKMYDDKHDKTYICDNGIKFYITRLG